MGFPRLAKGVCRSVSPGTSDATITPASEEPPLRLWMDVLEPMTGLEPVTCGLRNLRGRFCNHLLPSHTRYHRSHENPLQHVSFPSCPFTTEHHGVLLSSSNLVHRECTDPS